MKAATPDAKPEIAASLSASYVRVLNVKSSTRPHRKAKVIHRVFSISIKDSLRHKWVICGDEKGRNPFLANALSTLPVQAPFIVVDYSRVQVRLLQRPSPRLKMGLLDPDTPGYARA